MLQGYSLQQCNPCILNPCLENERLVVSISQKKIGDGFPSSVQQTYALRSEALNLQGIYAVQHMIQYCTSRGVQEKTKVERTLQNFSAIIEPSGVLFILQKCKPTTSLPYR